MKECFDKIIVEAVAQKDVCLFGKHAQRIAKQFGVSHKTVYNRFKSMYGQSPQDIIKERLLPSKEKLISVILNSSTAEECNQILDLPRCLSQGLYDKVLGTSTYHTAKLRILRDMPISVRKTTYREDNVSILMSQYLGDGSYDRVRHSLRISHSIKQAEYLRWKVGLIHDGYNTVPTEIRYKTHTQGHEYVDWYSKKLGNVDFPQAKEQAVNLLTPIGWLLWYLDDGHWGQDIQITNGYLSVVLAGQKELETYGIKSRISKCSGAKAYNLIMRGQANSLMFFKNFIEPFSEIIPECMKYKTEMKIESGEASYA